MELRQHRKPRDAERHDWIKVLLMGEELSSLDSGVFRVDQIAQALGWASEHKCFEALDRLRQNLIEITKTDFRQA